MLQPWDGEDGAKKKDSLEKRLQQLVCSKEVGLRDAQAAIYGDSKAARGLSHQGATGCPRKLADCRT